MGMSDVGRSGGLGVIFSFFLGLMVTAFFGVGVFTFYPSPEMNQEAIDEINIQDQQIRKERPLAELSDDERAQINQLDAERRAIYEEWEELSRVWGRNTSIILVTLATATMAISLVRSHALPVVSNGLLLGGLFTMLYGVGWILFTDRAIARFIVIALALAITLVLGYIRFVRQRPALQPRVPVGPAQGTSADLASIEQRLSDLEKRIHGAASALGQGTDQRKDR